MCRKWTDNSEMAVTKAKMDVKQNVILARMITWVCVENQSLIFSDEKKAFA